MAHLDRDDRKAQEMAEERRNRITGRVSIFVILAAIILAVGIAVVGVFQYLTALE